MSKAIDQSEYPHSHAENLPISKALNHEGFRKSMGWAYASTGVRLSPSRYTAFQSWILGPAVSSYSTAVTRNTDTHSRSGFSKKER